MLAISLFLIISLQVVAGGKISHARTKIDLTGSTSIPLQQQQQQQQEKRFLSPSSTDDGDSFRINRQRTNSFSEITPLQSRITDFDTIEDDGNDDSFLFDEELEDLPTSLTEDVNDSGDKVVNASNTLIEEDDLVTDDESDMMQAADLLMSVKAEALETTSRAETKEKQYEGEEQEQKVETMSPTSNQSEYDFEKYDALLVLSRIRKAFSKTNADEKLSPASDLDLTTDTSLVKRITEEFAV